MQRRTFLIWFGRAAYTACAAVVAGAGAKFLAAPQPATSMGGGMLRRRVATLDSLPVGEPQLLPVFGTRQDAWVRHADQVVGRIWVTRTSSADIPPVQTKLSIFSAACPHSGCPIQKAVAEGYVCHCHGAKFQPDGSKATDGEGFTNPSPRGMDPLDHHVVQDKTTGQWWVEVEFKEFEVGLVERVERA